MGGFVARAIGVYVDFPHRCSQRRRQFGRPRPSQPSRPSEPATAPLPSRRRLVRLLRPRFRSCSFNRRKAASAPAAVVVIASAAFAAVRAVFSRGHAVPAVAYHCAQRPAVAAAAATARTPRPLRQQRRLSWQRRQHRRQQLWLSRSLRRGRPATRAGEARDAAGAAAACRRRLRRAGARGLSRSPSATRPRRGACVTIVFVAVAPSNKLKLKRTKIPKFAT